MLLVNIHDFTETENSQMVRPTGNSHTDYYRKITDLASLGDRSKLIGFFGQPDQRTMEIFRDFGYSFIDLDIDFRHPNQKFVPEAYCHIIRDIINNAIALRDRLGYVICTTGSDKCDQGRNVRDMLCQMDFQVIDSSNRNRRALRKPIISEARGKLKDRVIRIMELVYRPLTEEEERHYIENVCEPRFNYHGVPPQDIELLNLFPDTTHIQGWTRMVEMGIPSRVDLEWEIANASPTVYYSQSFCNKQMMAEYLSKRQCGLYIDGHGTVTGSLRAKLEAFLSLRAKGRDLPAGKSYEPMVSGLRP